MKRSLEDLGSGHSIFKLYPLKQRNRMIFVCPSSERKIFMKGSFF